MCITQLVNYASNMELPIVPYLLMALARPTQLADLLANPLIDQYARTYVSTLFTLAEKTFKRVL